MKGPLIAVLVVVLLAVAGGAYLLLRSPSTSSTTGTSQSISSTSSQVQIQGAPAHVTVSFVSCISNGATCSISLVNSGGTVQATGCTLSGSAAVFSPKPASLPAGGLVDVSCSPAKGTSLPIPGFHVEGAIQLSDGSSVQFTGSWQ